MEKQQLDALHREIEKLQERYELSKTAAPDYYEPGMMEYLEQSRGIYQEATGEILFQFEVKGTRYEGRTELIESIQAGNPVEIVRDPDNPYNSNNFRVMTPKGKDLGNMPADLCNAIAPLYDEKAIAITGAEVSFAEPISKRSRHAKQAVLFVKMTAKL